MGISREHHLLLPYIDSNPYSMIDEAKFHTIEADKDKKKGGPV